MRFNKDIIVVEGGMETMLERAGFTDEPCLPYLNVLEPEAIIDVHRYYHLAGAQAVITNTFGATAAQLSVHGLSDRMEELNHAGMLLARTCKPEHILACVGPSGIEILPPEEDGPDPSVSYQAASGQYADQIAVLAADEPDAILLDTFESIADLVCALDACRKSCALPVIASCSCTPEGTLSGSSETLASAARACEAAGADVFGINCIVSPDEMLPLLKTAREQTGLPLLVRPDVSTGARRGTAPRIAGSPSQMEQRALDYWRAGAQFIGTCCGSTPAYTGAIYASVSGLDVVVRR